MAKKKPRESCDPREKPPEAAGAIARPIDPALKEDGAKWFNAGEGIEACPFPPGDTRRVDWFCGYYAAQVEKNVGHILRKYELKK